MLPNPGKVKLMNTLLLGQEWAGIMRDASTPVANLPAALHTAWPGRTGSQTTYLATYTNYANVNVPRSSSGFTVNQTTGAVVLANNVVFPRSSGSGNDQYCPFFTLGDGTGIIVQCGAITMSGTTPRPFTALAANDTLTAVAHGGLSTNRCTVVAIGNASLPGGLTEGAVYYVRSDVTTNTLTLSTTSGGATIDITSDGAGILMILDGFQVGNNYEPTLNTSSAILID